MVESKTIWLNRAVDLMRPYFRRSGYTLPHVINVVCEPCSHEDWWGETYAGAIPKIVIPPKIDQGYGALQCLIHELCHPAADRKARRRVYHEKPFIDCAVKIGLAPHGGFPVTEQLSKRLQKWAAELGPYK